MEYFIFSRSEMTVFNLYVLGKGGQSLYYREWLREKDSQLSRSEEDKLMAGLVFSLSNFSRKMALLPDGATFKSLKTNKFQLHHWESPTGIKFILNTSIDVGPCSDTLTALYHGIFVPTVVKNPLVPLTETIQSDLWSSKLDSFIKQLVFFQES